MMRMEFQKTPLNQLFKLLADWGVMMSSIRDPKQKAKEAQRRKVRTP
jgi:hypothetical protein